MQYIERFMNMAHEVSGMDECGIFEELFEGIIADYCRNAQICQLLKETLSLHLKIPPM